MNKNKGKVINKIAGKQIRIIEKEKRSCNVTLLAVVCFMFAFILYSNTFQHSYVLDDNVITQNQIVKKGLQGISEILNSPYRYGINHTKDNLYRPFSQIMFAVEWQISPNNPHLSHFINVLFYALSCLLLFIVLRKYMSKVHSLIPFVITLLYTAHPIHTEVVANIKSRDEIMSFFFLMLTLLFLHKWFNLKNWKSLIISLFLFFLAFLSKEGVITMIFIFPVIGWYFTDAKPKTILYAFLFLVIPAITFVAIRHHIISTYHSSDAPQVIENILVYAPDAASHFATAVMLLGKYLLLLIFPYQLVCDYGYNQIQVVGFTNPLFIISLIVYLAMGIYTVINFRGKSHGVFGLLFFLITISMYNNILFQIGTSFGERLMFLPSLGLCIAFVFFISKWQNVGIDNLSRQSVFSILKSKPLFTSIFFVIILVFSVKTVVRAAEWESAEKLFGNDLSRSPNSYHLSMWVGDVLYEKALKEEDKASKEKIMLQAVEKYEKAVTIYPKHYESFSQLSLAWFNIGEINKGLSYAFKALALDSTKAVLWYNIGRAYSQSGDPVKAVEYYKKAIKLDPNYADAYFYIGSILGVQKKYEEAIVEFKKCIQVNPDYVMAYHFIGVTYQNLNQQEEADRWFEKVRILEQKKNNKN